MTETNEHARKLEREIKELKAQSPATAVIKELLGEIGRLWDVIGEQREQADEDREHFLSVLADTEIRYEAVWRAARDVVDGARLTSVPV